MPSGEPPEGVYESDDGNWYGIAPAENADDEPKYDLNTCNDVKDAYNLRNNGDYDVTTETLVARIKRAGKALECPPEFKPWIDSSDTAHKTTMSDLGDDSPSVAHSQTTTMSNNDDPFRLDELRTTVIVDEHDGVAELIDEKDSTIDDLEATVDEKDSRIEDLEDDIAELETTIDEYESRLREQAVADLEEKVERLADLTDSVDTDQFSIDEEDGLDTVEETIKEVEQFIDVAEGATSEVATPPTNDNQTDKGDNGNEAPEDGVFDLRQQTA